jgi:aspartate/methionine/tyrosine aminotransferase
LKEENQWSIEASSLKKSFNHAIQLVITPKILIAINPLNSAGSAMDEKRMKEIAVFCEKH